MASLIGQAPASFFKDLVHISNSNAGVDSTLRKIYDGNGNVTAIYLSDDNFKVQPNNDDTIAAFNVVSKAGNSILTVDTDNGKVNVGRSQVAANTQYAHFGISRLDIQWSSQLADTWYAVPFMTSSFSINTIANMALGTANTSTFNDTDPASSLTIATTAHDIVGAYWYVMDNITVDAVHWFHGADAATGDSTAARLMAYDIDVSNNSTSGDLSNGFDVAKGAAITNAGYEQVYHQILEMQTADVDAGQVILFTFASDTVNSDFSINATVKYHIR